MRRTVLQLVCLAICCSTVWSDSATRQELTWSTNSPKARALFDRGLAKYDRVRYKEAAELFRQAFVEDPEFAAALLFRGLAGDSIPDIRRSRELAGKVPEPEQLFIQSYKAHYDGKLPEAIESAEKAVKLLPREPRLRLRVAQLQRAALRRPEALAEAQGAIAIDPAFAPAYNLLGELYIAEREFDKAIQARTRYAELLPGEAEPLQAIAHTYQQMQEFPKAIEFYTRALKADPDYVNVYRRRGDARFFAGDVEGARKDYQRGFDRAKGLDRDGPLYATAFTYVHEGAIDKALETYHRAIAIGEEDGNYHSIIAGNNALGQSLLEAGRLDDAAAAYERAYRAAMRAPEFTDRDRGFYTAQSHHARGRIAARRGDFKGAMKEVAEFRVAMKASGYSNAVYNDKSYQYLLGYILLEKREYEGALGALLLANTDDVFIKLLLARAHQGLGDNDIAYTLMQEIADYTLGSVASSIARPQALRWLAEKGAAAKPASAPDSKSKLKTKSQLNRSGPTDLV